MKVFLATICLMISTFAFSQEEKWSDFFDQIEDQLKSDDYNDRIEAIETFTNQDNRDAVEYLIDVMLKKKEHPWVRDAASEVISGFDSDVAKKSVSDSLKRNRIPNIYLLQAYIAHGHDDAVAQTVEAIKNSKDNSTISSALDVVTKFEGPFDDRLIELVASYLDEKYFHAVRRSAARTLGSVPAKSAFEPLLANLEDLVVGDTVRESLLRLTGQEFWRDRGDWEKWWSDNKDSFTPEPLDDVTFAEKHEKLLEKKGEDKVPDFYEREFTGKNILFLLDASGSMKNEAGESNRIDLLKAELIGLMDSLNSEYNIGFVFFPHDEFPSKGIDKVDRGFVRKAEKFLEGVKAEGGTPMWEALEYAYEKLVEKENIDTIYLLSDGSPTDATKSEIIQRVSEYTEIFGVKINTISIGSSSSLLRELAELSGGNYWSKDY